METSHIQFIKKPKQQIIQSRYHAARPPIKEQLLLYYSDGKTLSGKVKVEG